MTTARETVLGRIRDALTLAPAQDAPVRRAYRTGRTLPDGERLALFTDRLVDYKAEVRTCTAEGTAETIAEALREHGARRTGVPAGLDTSWLSAYDGEVLVDSADIPAPRLDALDGVVTASAVGCAETGTIFLDGSAEQGRRALSLVPDLHVCVVDLSAVEVGVPEAVARLAPDRPTTLISGPSATSDIELERVEGVHGPRTLVVVIRTDL
ncbi:lactate utilization protein C [Streptomyces sp. NPDC052042]|uniref:lactate utilization protein C n=1 Tax=Streptomyces sp. NPDC052042 TaxID=3365683 RepID=UPI0037D60EDB